MLRLIITLSDAFDDEKNEFITETCALELEHSLVALSKWESKHEKPFLAPGEKSTEEVMDYIRCMIFTPKYPPEEILDKLSEKDVETIQEYIDAKMTATWFNETGPSAPSREKITSELIYYWMVSYQIPWAAENWHLKRLFTLIKIFNAKNEKPKKMGPGEMAAQRRALNEERRARLGTSG